MKKILKWGLIIFGVIILLAIISPKDNKKQEATTTKNIETVVKEEAEPTEPKTKEYVKVFEAKGNAGKKTDSFILQGGKQKLTYTFNGGSSIVGGVYVLKEGTSLEKQGGIPEVMVSEAGTDNTILRKSAGTYYLDVTVANASWLVTIEEER